MKILVYGLRSAFARSRGPKNRRRWRLGLVQTLLRQELALLDAAVDLALAVEDPVELLVMAPLQQA